MNSTHSLHKNIIDIDVTNIGTQGNKNRKLTDKLTQIQCHLKPTVRIWNHCAIY